MDHFKKASIVRWALEEVVACPLALLRDGIASGALPRLAGIAEEEVEADAVALLLAPFASHRSRWISICRPTGSSSSTLTSTSEGSTHHSHGVEGSAGV